MSYFVFYCYLFIYISSSGSITSVWEERELRSSMNKPMIFPKSLK